MLLEDPASTDWDAALTRIEYAQPLVTAFRARKPVKGLTLPSNRVSDMLTRYVALYSRLGSPDLPQSLMDSYAGEIGRLS